MREFTVFIALWIDRWANLQHEEIVYASNEEEAIEKVIGIIHEKGLARNYTVSIIDVVGQ